MHSDSARSAADTPPREVVRLRRSARVVLVPVAVIGAVLSFAGIYEAAAPSYGPVLSAGFPFLVDFLILGASLQYIAGAKVGRPRAGWRLTAHAGVAGTLVLNAMAAQDLAHLPWHVVAPAVWSVLVEMSAREVIGEYRALRRAPADRIPARLWFTAPVESTRTWLLMARSGARSHAEARVDVGVLAAAG
jgi:peptidoglycan/LPS O-acetylase OafA/YrhL